MGNRVDRQHALGLPRRRITPPRTARPRLSSIRDAELRPQILRVWEENLAVYGADKIWDQLNKDGVSSRPLHRRALDARHGLCRAVAEGCVWVKHDRVGDDAFEPAGRPGRSQVHRASTESALGRGPDLRQDAFGMGLRRVHRRRVLAHGRWLASQSRSLQIGLWRSTRSRWLCSTGKRQGADLSALIHHSDRGVQYLSVRYSDRLADNDDRRVGRLEGRQLRQRSGRELQRALQVGADLQAGPLARSRRRRVRHPRPTSTGSTTDVSTARSKPAPASPPRPRSRPPTTVNPSPPTRPGLNNPSLYRTRGASGTCSRPSQTSR